MHTTRISLLERIKDYQDNDAWNEFHRLYAPLLYSYARYRRVDRSDAEDIRDECMAVVCTKIKNFEYDPGKGRFKSFLRHIVSCKVTDLYRKHRPQVPGSVVLKAHQDPGEMPDEVWDRRFLRQHARECAKRAEAEVGSPDYQVFYLRVFEGCSVATVGERLNLQPKDVYTSTRKVLDVARRIAKEQFPDLDLNEFLR